MLQLFLAATIAPLLLAADASLPAGTEIHFRGSVEPTSAEAPPGRKDFDLTLWILSTKDDHSEVCWLIDERGNGAFPWTGRWGRATLDGDYRSSALGPAVLYDRGEGQSVVPIIWPFLKTTSPLAEEAQFRDGDLEFRVESQAKRAEGDAWLLNVRDGFGPKRTLAVDRNGPLVLEMDERLTMGRGEGYRMQLHLEDSRQLSEPELTALAQSSATLSAIRDKLNLAAHAQENIWTAQQAELLRQELPEAVENAKETPLHGLAQTALRDLELQTGRNDAVATMQARFAGQPVEELRVRGTAGESLSLEDLKDKVTVLHFWDYRDAPLREPYGQIGYLDFLYQRHKTAGLQLYGVAVNSRLAEESTRRAAVTSVKKLKSFMNLSYPVLLDGGALLRQFGDPRVIGASLPLFVVIGPDGKIQHYHVGTYEVRQDQGLKELDDVVREMLGKK